MIDPLLRMKKTQIQNNILLCTCVFMLATTLCTFLVGTISSLYTLVCGTPFSCRAQLPPPLCLSLPFSLPAFCTRQRAQVDQQLYAHSAPESKCRLHLTSFYVHRIRLSRGLPPIDPNSASECVPKILFYGT
jgi:hypothetical protein